MMKVNSSIRQIRDERLLMLFSYLQTRPENSAFSGRLMACTTLAIIDLKHRQGIRWKVLEDILENGTPMEDPQEQMFTHLVGSPLGSFIVYPGPFQFYQYALTRLLNLCGLPPVADNQRLRMVYFLLGLSQAVADRMGARRYSGGMPGTDDVFVPDSKCLERDIESLYFSREYLEGIARQHSLSLDCVEEFTFRASRKDLREEVSRKGYSEAVTLTPFYRYDNGYILLSPSALLHSAYHVCKQMLIDGYGLDFVRKYSESLFDETACVLHGVSEPFLGSIDLDGKSFLLYREDDETVFCVFPYLVEEHQDIVKCRAAIDSYVRENIQANGISMLIIVYSQVEDDSFGMCVPKDALAFSIDDFAVVLSQPGVNLNTLYYYLQDKHTIETNPFSQEMDLFAYYIKRRQTFYMEERPDCLMVETGMAMELRERYYVGSDVRYVESAMFRHVIPVVHIHDMPGGVPAYMPLYAPSQIAFFMIEIGSHRLTIKYDSTVIDNYEIVRSMALWLYAAWKARHVSVLKSHVDVVLKMGDGDSIRRADEHVYGVTLNIDRLFADGKQDIEESVLSHFVCLLQSRGLVSEEITDVFIHAMLAEAKGHFMLADVKGDNPLLYHDGVTACHYLSDRWTDKVLDEIACFLDYRGEEKKLSIDESKDIMRRVMGYLEREAKAILSSVDTGRMLMNGLALHHAMIYWSRLTNYRYNYISQAYHYIGAELENQARYLNDYTEMNILVQGLIEYIIQADIHSEGNALSISTFDRLFAIMHHIVNMGMYFDLLNGGQADSEMVLLKNGRLVFPHLVEEINIPYFSTLRKRTMEHRDVILRQHRLMPQYEVDKDKQDFKDAFTAEFGLDIESLFGIYARSIDHANKREMPVISVPKNVFDKEILLASIPVGLLSAFYAHFVLSKESYTDIEPKDRLLQRYNRSVQLSSRPWVLYEDNILYSTKSIYTSCQVLIDRLDAGTIRHSSTQMGNYIGKISKNKGHLFTQNLGAYFKSLKEENLIVNMEVQICPGKPLAAEENLGDIDVLLIGSKRKMIVCIEAKDYYGARTVYDMISQNNKIAKALPKVVRRDEWCKTHKSLFRFYSKDIDDTYKVKTVFLTYKEPTYKYFRHDNVPDIKMMSAFEIIQNPSALFS